MKKADLLLEQMKIASELHRHMDEMAWQGLSHLLMWNGILVSALGVALASAPCSQVTSGRLRIQPPCAIAAVLVTLLGAVISIGWACVQKRAQMYHRVRVAQARDAEKALVAEVSAQEQDAAKGQPVRVYPDDPPLEVYKHELCEIPLKRFGRTLSHSAVFRIALVIAGVWFLLLVVV